MEKKGYIFIFFTEVHIAEVLFSTSAAVLIGGTYDKANDAKF